MAKKKRKRPRGEGRSESRGGKPAAQGADRRPSDDPGADVWRSRREVFRDVARRRARGEFVFGPELLPKGQRRLHVRQTILEDHRFRVQNRPEGARAKFEKLAKSAWNFFRGTALLYYRDRAGTDAGLPTVLAIGDVHPENFGVMPHADGMPVFGLDDFDESHVAPFSWDVERGATGFLLCAREEGLSKKHARKAARRFVRAYLGRLRQFAESDRREWHEYRLDNSPPMIRDLLDSAYRSRKEFLAAKLDLERRAFRPTEEVVPHSTHVEAFQRAIDEYARSGGVKRRGGDGRFRVKDVAVKKGSGTASLGLDRYWVLIDGPGEDPFDDVLLELKQSRESALAGLVPESPESAGGKADRVLRAHEVHLAGGDPYYGTTTIEGRSFLVRERSPFKDGVDVEDLDPAGWKEYADVCGRILAQAHARSDEETAATDDSAARRILDAVQPKVFADDVLRFARRAAKRVAADHELFRADFALGAFDVV